MPILTFNASLKLELEAGESVSVIWNKLNVSVTVWRQNGLRDLTTTPRDQNWAFERKKLKHIDPIYWHNMICHIENT